MEGIEEMIAQAEEIAKSGTREEQESFVEYLCGAISWFSSQGDSQSCEFFQKAYKSYLNAKGEEQSVQALAEQSGKSKASIYNEAKKLGRLPTLEELKSKKKGRPRKYY